MIYYGQRNINMLKEPILKYFTNIHREKYFFYEINNLLYINLKMYH
jgi:uncharacterized protein YbcV (DUF1398 family)